MKEKTKQAIDRYAEHHTPTGSFLKAVLENDLAAAVGRADEDNLRDIKEIVQYVYWEIPSPCWGNPEKVKKWLKGGEDVLQIPG